MSLVGLVGCGNWGKNIFRDLLALGCQVVVADVDPAVRDRVLAQGAAGACSEARDLPACDGYVVAVPIPQLEEMCACLLPREKPVFSEKTLCLSDESGRRLAALGGHDRLYAMHKWRYHPGVEALRQVAQSGRLGQLEEIRLTRHAWVRDLHGGDVFWTLAVHDLTIVKHILGRIPTAEKAWVRREGDLPVSLLGVLDDGVRVTLSTCARHCARQSAASIHGRQGSAAMPDPYLPHILMQAGSGGPEQVAVDTTFPLFLELREFVEHLRGGVAPRCPLSEAIEVTSALLDLRLVSGLEP